MNYYIQGSKEREAEIKAAFKQLGCEYNGIWCSDNLFYFTLDGKVYATAQESCKAIIKTHPDYQELELPKPHYDIANFHAGMPVLVRDYDNSRWSYVQFSHYVGECGMKFNACGIPYIQCIPFEGNEHLLGTTEPCDERFINWQYKRL